MSMDKKNEESNKVLYALLFLLVLAVSWLVYENISYRLEDVNRGYQGEARSNPYLASEYFLHKMGQKSEKIDLFSSDKAKLQTNDSLFISNTRISYDRQLSKQLLNWVAEGGHLILTAKVDYEKESSRHDYILDDLGLSVQRHVPSEQQQDDLPSSLDIEDEIDFWQVDFDDYLIVTYADEFKQQVVWEIFDEDDLHAVQIKYQSGLITLLSDTRMFRSAYIDLYDHGAFLFTLSNDQMGKDQMGNDLIDNVKGAKNNQGTFYYSIEEGQASLYSWLWKHAQPLMISLLIMMIIVLWMIVPRFGPIVHVKKTGHKEFSDHLKAAGNYYWRSGYYAKLLTDIKKQLNHRMQLKFSEWSQLSRDDQLKHFTTLSGLQLNVIKYALFDVNIEKIDDFVIKIKTLEKLRKSV